MTVNRIWTTTTTPV